VDAQTKTGVYIFDLWPKGHLGKKYEKMKKGKKGKERKKRRKGGKFAETAISFPK
jgi:hypothetical protein